MSIGENDCDDMIVRRRCHWENVSRLVVNVDEQSGKMVKKVEHCEDSQHLKSRHAYDVDIFEEETQSLEIHLWGMFPLENLRVQMTM
ncbi:hypothetical protein Tco_0918224 [Tanacetum coccineum]